MKKFPVTHLDLILAERDKTMANAEIQAFQVETNLVMDVIHGYAAPRSIRDRYIRYANLHTAALVRQKMWISASKENMELDKNLSSSNITESLIKYCGSKQAADQLDQYMSSVGSVVHRTKEYIQHAMEYIRDAVLLNKEPDEAVGANAQSYFQDRLTEINETITNRPTWLTEEYGFVGISLEVQKFIKRCLDAVTPEED